MLSKFLWLFAGLTVGIGLSSTFANNREPASYGFKVLAVSEEDAQEKAAEMLKDGTLHADLALEKVAAATVPHCKESGDSFLCETKLVYRE